ESIDWKRGIAGWKRVTARLTFAEGTPVARQALAETWIQTPVAARVIQGVARSVRPYMLPSRLKVRKEIRLKATAYTPGHRDNAPFLPGETASGLRAAY